jgi:Tol biopolymer transport system component
VIRLAWSPDGAALAVTICGRGQASEVLLCSVYRTNAAGGDRRLLVEGGLSYGWSPDGRSLLYQGMFPNNMLYRVDVASGERFGLIDFDPSTSAPAWSPDSGAIALTQILVSLTGPRLPRLVRINPDGLGLAALTDHAAGDFDPVWSPDGTRIAYLASTDYINTELYVTDADGGGSQRLNLPGVTQYHVWSPDSRRLAFIQTAQPGDARLMLTDPDAEQIETLREAVADFAPIWSGDMLYYVGVDLRLYRLNLTTRDVSPVTAQPIFAPREGGRALQRRPDL